MNNKKLLFVLLIPFLFISSSKLSSSAKDRDDPWKKWLDEVHLIITKTERSVFESLQTEEDKKKFQELFWKARDPRPETPQNEYKMEFYRRYKYAETDLEGANSDRGRIYILLGDPLVKIPSLLELLESGSYDCPAKLSSNGCKIYCFLLVKTISGTIFKKLCLGAYQTIRKRG